MAADVAVVDLPLTAVPFFERVFGAALLPAVVVAGPVLAAAVLPAAVLAGVAFATAVLAAAVFAAVLPRFRGGAISRLSHSGRRPPRWPRYRRRPAPR
jgi:hypothetical protein